MLSFTSLLKRLASKRDKELLEKNPSVGTHLRVLGRVGLRYWWAYLILLIALAASTVSAGMDVYHRTEQPEFCGACHEMSPNVGTWSASRHKDITCADCHAKPGLSGWVQAKAAGVKQLKVHFTAASIDNIKLEDRQHEIINGNCRRCHLGVARLGERLGLGVSHRQHLESGLECITCHTGAFTHPRPPATDGGTPDGGAGPAHLEQRFVDVKQCYGCHDGEQKAGQKVAFAASDEKNCLKCHPDADQALAHGAKHKSAATRKPCLDCHDALDGGTAHFVTGPVAPICAKCHEKEAHESKHSPYKKNECGECHRVMSPAHLYEVGPRMTNQLCLGCHDELAKLLEERNPAKPGGPFQLEGKDLHHAHKAKLDEVRNDWCLDCHHPHGSAAEFALLRMRQYDDFKKPQAYTVADEGGGRCEGGCHEAKPLTWSGE